MKIAVLGGGLTGLTAAYYLAKKNHWVTVFEKEKELGEKIGKLDVYKEKAEWEEDEPVPIKEPDETKIEGSEKKKFLNEWEQLKWYNFPEEKYNGKGKENHGFVKWSKLLIPFADSEVPPLQNWGNAWLQMEIVDIDEKKWTFTTKIHGGELSLGKHEGQKKEMPMAKQ